jgi:predicted outer membrane repeat protein
MYRPTHFTDRCRIRVLAGLFLGPLTVPASAAIYSVGQPSDTTCTHASLQAALDAASANASVQTHTIRIARPLIEVSMNAIEDAFRIVDPQANLLIEGNYASCADSAPGSNGSVSTLALSDGSVGRVLRVQNSGAQPRVVTLRNLRLRGGNTTSFPLNVAYGGALRASGALSLRLQRSEVTNSRASRGGGIAVLGGAELRLQDDSYVLSNEAEGLFGRGGGIYCADPQSSVVLDHAFINGNRTPGSGGGVHLDGCAGLRSGSSAIGGVAQGTISNNFAGTAGSSEGGLGGGVYVENSNLNFADSDNYTFSLLMRGNSARRGAALYSAGSVSQLPTLIVFNAAFIDNTARDRGGVLYADGRVDALFSHSRTERCEFTTFVRGTERSFVACSLMAGNRAQPTTGSSSSGGGIVQLVNSTGGSSSVQIERSVLAYNEDTGRAALAYVNGGAFSLLDSVAHANLAMGSGTGALSPSLLQLFAPGPHFLRRSTLIGNGAPQMALVDGANLDIAGSIVHDASMRVFRAANGGSLVHRGCLLIHPAQSDASLLEEIAPGFFSEGVFQSDPQLGADFMPSQGSNAIDGCSSARAGGGPDLYNQPRGTDVPGVVNFPFAGSIPGSYVNDLGAIERQNQGPIFSDGFEDP